MIDRVIEIEKLEPWAELTDDLDFWLNEPTADETVLADWLAPLVSAEEENDEFEKSADLLRVLSAAEVWGEAAAAVIEANVVDEVGEREEDLPVVNWPGIDPEDTVPILAEKSGGDFSEKLWGIGGVVNDATDEADVAASEVQALAVTESAGLAEEILAEFGVSDAADEAEEHRNVGAAVDGLLASGEVGIIADEVPGRIADEPVADLDENMPEMWPLIELREAADGIERRAVEYRAIEYGDFERQEPERNGEAAEARRDLADLAARLAGPVADLVAARLNDELQIMLRSR